MTDRFKRLEFRAERAVQPLEQQVELQGEPKRDARTYLQAAIDADRLGQFESALRLHTRALREDRTLIAAWVGQVQMLVELTEYDEARLWSDKALELFRNNGELYAAKARACARLGDRRAAHACSDASLQAPGSSPARWQARGEVLLAHGEKRCRECFEKSLAESRADWFDNVLIARIYLHYRKAAAALQHASTAAESQPGHSYVWYLIGQAQMALGWHAAAQSSLQRSLELEPTCPGARSALLALDNRSVLSRFGHWLTGWRRR